MGKRTYDYISDFLTVRYTQICAGNLQPDNKAHYTQMGAAGPLRYVQRTRDHFALAFSTPVFAFWVPLCLRTTWFLDPTSGKLAPATFGGEAAERRSDAKLPPPHRPTRPDVERRIAAQFSPTLHPNRPDVATPVVDQLPPPHRLSPSPQPSTGRAEGRISLDIPVLVDTKEVSALVDTGADYSILSGRLATTLKKVTTPWEGPDIRTAGGHVVAPLGMCAARVTVRGCTFVATFLVLRECSRDVILGIDFLREHGAIIDLPNRLVTFSTKLATAEPAHQGSQSALRVAEDNITVPPRASILARVTCDEPQRGLRVVEPNVSLVLTKGIAVARGLSYLHDGWTEVLITNFCNEHRHLLRGTAIAYVDRVQEVAECFACEEDTTGGDAEALDNVNINPGLSSAEKGQLQDLLREFRACFTTSSKAAQATTSLFYFPYG
ncbi:uncharacterized protein LOC144124516 [Amblyomma americanum]